MFTAPNHMRFAYEAVQVPKLMQAEFKARFKKSGLTPREFAKNVYQYEPELAATEKAEPISNPDSPSKK